VKQVMLGALIGAAAAWLMGGWSSPAPAIADGKAPRQELIAFNTAIDGHRQQLTIVDPGIRVVGVYHVDGEGGEIRLKSVRNIHWDLQMTEFNTVSPLPQEIHSLIDQR